MGCFAGLFIASVVQSLSLTPSATDAFAMTLKGTVLVYNVTGEPVSEPSDTFGLWNYLLVSQQPASPFVQPAAGLTWQCTVPCCKAGFEGAATCYCHLTAVALLRQLLV